MCISVLYCIVLLNDIVLIPYFTSNAIIIVYFRGIIKVKILYVISLIAVIQIRKLIENISTERVVLLLRCCHILLVFLCNLLQ